MHTDVFHIFTEGAHWSDPTLCRCPVFQLWLILQYERLKFHLKKKGGKVHVKVTLIKPVIAEHLLHIFAADTLIKPKSR